MVKLAGPTSDDVGLAGDAYTKVVLDVVNRTLERTANDLRGFVSPNDLGPIRKTWADEVDAELLDHVGAAFALGAGITRVNQHDALVRTLRRSLTAAATTAEVTGDPFRIPLIENARGNELLKNARNRLVNVGDDVWLHARSQLVEGMQAGEGIAALKQRVIGSAQFSGARAEVVARSEVAHAMNQGSLAQMGQLTSVNVEKEWLAVDDGRTRPAHAVVDGQRRPLDHLFSTGDNPGDEPNCRCTLGYDIPDDDTAGQDLSTGEHVSSEESFVQQACGCTDPRLTSALTAGPYDVGELRRAEQLTSPCECETGAAGAYVSDDLYQTIKQQAEAKIESAPVPTAAAVEKSRVELERARRGEIRAGGESRGGSAADRRRQRLNLFKEFGGEDRGYVACHGCGLKIHWADPGSADNPLGLARFERGKIFVKCQGGGYQLMNLLPECFSCNRSRNDQLLRNDNAC